MPPNESPSLVLPQAPAGHYNFKHTVANTVPVPRPIVLWNVLDFGHVNWVHRYNYAYCKVLAESNRTTLLEYGIRVLFFLGLPLKSAQLMWHEYVPPNLVRHLSRSPWGAYTKVEMILDEYEENGQTHTRLTHHYATHLPAIMLPFKKLFAWYIEAWSNRLWEEDYGMMLRRHQVLKAGFKDHPADTTPRAVEGFLS